MDGRPASAAATVAVAFSGGRDSLALLHATACAARDCGLEVLALHVHHGLAAEADDWVRSAIALTRRWRARGLPLRLRWHRVQGAPAPGDSLEAWARRERYAALAQLAREEGAAAVLLAQHRRDQAETVLLQALRSAGPRGLAAMPAAMTRHGVLFLRPWLTHPREAIEAYVRRHRLRPIEDPSNADTRLARNRLRRQVWPALQSAFPDAEAALAAVARRAQQADAALAELAAQDLAAAADESGLQLAAWLALSPARRANALRRWLAVDAAGGVPETLVQRLLDELPGKRSGRWPLDAQRACLLHRGRLRLAPLQAGASGLPRAIDLSRPGRIELPDWGGAFEVEVAAQGGIALALLRAAELRPRSGGERFQRSPRGSARSLKKQYQAAGIAAVERDGPLLWCGEHLLFVPGLGIDARAQAPAGEPQCRLQWQRRPRD